MINHLPQYRYFGKFFILSVTLFSLIFLITACGEDKPRVPSGSNEELNPESLTYNVYQLLLASGNSVEVGGIVEDPHFEVDGRLLKLDSDRIVVFEYSSAEDVEDMAAGISADGATIDGKPVEWSGTPHLYKTSKVIVVYQGDNSSTLDALELAVGEQFAGG